MARVSEETLGSIIEKKKQQRNFVRVRLNADEIYYLLF